MSKPRTTTPLTTNGYKYTQEISQMMFVFGEVQNPIIETVHLIEDIVRSQIIEMITQARSLANRHGARSVSAEDLIFLIRHDRSKVNRLKSYLSWKHIRGRDKGDGGNIEMDVLEEGEVLTETAQKVTIRLPWEIPIIYSEVLKNTGEDEEDEEDLEAHQAYIERLKEADEATRDMTREEYQHYSDCRHASFTWRKTKRFREFLNLPPQLDLKGKDDTFDIVGFLAFEMVRTLTLGGLSIKRSLEDVYDLNILTASALPLKRRSSTSTSAIESPVKRRRSDSPGPDLPPVSTLFLPPLEARTPLRPEHIQDAFTRSQRDWSHHRTAGLRNFRGGLVRTNVCLI